MALGYFLATGFPHLLVELESIVTLHNRRGLLLALFEWRLLSITLSAKGNHGTSEIQLNESASPLMRFAPI